MYRFYSRPTETKSRVTVVGEYSEGVLKIAASRCSEKDNFRRKTGRAIAEGRLKKGKLFSSVLLKDCNIKKFVTFAKDICNQIDKNPQDVVRVI